MNGDRRRPPAPVRNAVRSSIAFNFGLGMLLGAGLLLVAGWIPVVVGVVAAQLWPWLMRRLDP